MTGTANTYPRGLFLTIIVVCVAPALCMAVGVDFGLSLPGNGAGGGSGLGPSGLESSYLHTMLEWTAVCAALFTGMCALTHYAVRRDRITGVLTLALLSAGLLDAVHVLAADNLLSPAAAGAEFASFTWFVSRVFCAVALLAGPLVLLLRRERAGQTTQAVGVTIGLLLGAAAVIGMGFASTTPFLDVQGAPDAIVARPYDLVPLALFMVAGTIVLPAFHRAFPTVFSKALLISIIPQVAAQAYMALGSTVPHDGAFNVAHVLKAVAYLVPVSGLLIEYISMYRQEESIRVGLQEAQGALEASRERYRALARHLPNSAVFLFDDDLQALVAEGTALEWLGCKPEDIEGHTLSEALPPQAMEALAPSFRSALRGEEQVLEYTDGGHIFQVHVVPMGSGQDDVPAAMALLVDVTDKHEAERALRLTQFSVDRAVDAVMWITSDGGLIYVNEALSQLVGYPEDELRAMTLADLDPGMAGDVFRDYWAQVKTDTRVVTDTRLRTHDGIFVPVEVNCRYLDFDGQEYLCAFSRDITDRLAQVQLRADKEAAEAASRAKSQFLTNMSHELRTPLNSVIGFANILLKNKKGNLLAKDTKYLTRILNNGRHLLSLINDALDLSKVEAGKMTMIIEEVDLDELIHDVVEQLAVQVRHKPVKLLVNVTVTKPTVQSDGAKMRQVLINLLGNAIKFTAEGSVTVNLREEPGEPGLLRLEISDTGIGIPQDMLAEIFEPFQQADENTDRQYGGTGLGLALCKTMVEFLDHRIECDSEEGIGSTFRIIMRRLRRIAPATSPGAGGTPELHFPVTRPLPAAGPSPKPGGEPVVLVIDDNTDALTLLRDAVTECGVKVVTAASGRDGLRMARELVPRLIVLDILMPEMDGKEVLQEIRKSPGLKNVPVAVVSFVGSEQRKYLQGAAAVIDKPASREAVHQVVHDSLGRARKRVLVVDDDELVRSCALTVLTGPDVQVRTAANGEAGLRILNNYAADVVFVDLRMPVMDGFGFIGGLRARTDSDGLPVVALTEEDVSDTEQTFLEKETSLILRKGTELGDQLQEVVSKTDIRGGASA